MANFIVQGGRGGRMPDDYARQGSNPDATLTDTQAYAKAAAEAAQSLIAVDADIFAGKQALAANISAKGVPTAVADALTTMATKVLQIPQQINTRASEFEQIITPSPYMWNVYSVASDLMKNELPAYFPEYMSSGNYMQYRANNAFFVGEYYKGYVSLLLEGADGYLTSDGCFYTFANGIVTRTAPNGDITTYADTTIVHTWLDNDSENINRWVAFFYLTNAYSYINGDANICPRRVAVCGLCTSFVISGSNRLCDVWVIGSLSGFNGGTDGLSWSSMQAINLDDASSCVYYGANNVINMTIVANSVSGNIVTFTNDAPSTYSIILACNSIYGNFKVFDTNYRDTGSQRHTSNKNLVLLMSTVRIISGGCIFLSNSVSGGYVISIGCREINLPHLEEIGENSYIVQLSNYSSALDPNTPTIEKIIMPELVTINGKIWNQSYNFDNSLPDLIDVEVGELTTNLNMNSWGASNVLSDADKKTHLIDNIKNHILAKVSDRTGLSSLTFTVRTSMYNAIASETITWQDQTMTLADAFLTKNWLLAGA